MVVGWNIFLWMTLDLILSRVLCFVMAVLQLIVVCLVVILYASALAVLPILARSSIHCLSPAWFVGSGDVDIMK